MTVSDDHTHLDDRHNRPMESLLGLMGDRLIGREPELELLRNALGRAGAGGTELLCLIGPSGVGKTSVLSAFIADTQTATVGTGLYNQVASGPHGGLVEALREVVQVMLGKPAEVVDLWSEKLNEGLGAGAPVLTGLIPELDIVLGSAESGSTPDSEATRDRLARAAASLIAVTAAVEGPVLLILDDMQWAESTDVDLIGGLLATHPAGLMVVTAWVSDQAHRLDRLIEMAHLPAGRAELLPLDKSGIRDWLAQFMGDDIPGEIVAMIEQRTGGNPTYLDELLRRAVAEEALKLDMASGHWRWESDWLGEQPVTEGLADLFAESLRSLPPDQSRILAAAACIGGPFDLPEAIAASTASSDLVAEALWAGIDAGFLIGTSHSTQTVLDSSARYRFAHDRIAEAARRMLSQKEQTETHLRLGRAYRDQADPHIFQAVTHLAHAADLVTDPEERLKTSELALSAAQLARNQASFSSALEYFDIALRFLEDERIQADQERVALLCYGAAEAAWLSGDDRLDSLIEAAWDSAESFVDRARLAGLRMKIDLARHEQRRAMDIAVSSLDELGIALPRKPTRARLLIPLLKTSMALRGKTDDDLANLPRATDPRVIAAAPVLTELFSTSYTADPDLFPFVVLEAIDMTLEHGRLPVSPVAFAGYGLLQVVLGRHDEALRFGDLALRMVESTESLDYRPWVWFLHYNFIHHWRRPIAESIAPIQEAQVEALNRGDLEYAGYLAAVEIAERFNLGTPFETLDARCKELIATFPTQQKQIELCESVRQLAHNLAGLNPDPKVLAGATGYDERVTVPIAEEQNDLVSLAVHASVKLGLTFWSADFESVPEAGDRMERYIDGLTGTSALPTIRLTDALGRIRGQPSSRATRKIVARTLARFEDWADGAPENYRSGLLLLQGEWARVEGRQREAEQRLDEAIRVADENNQPLVGGLAREAAALLYAESARQVAARAFVVEAASTWAKLGFKLRLDWLRSQYDWLDETEVAEPHPISGRKGDFEELVTSLLHDAVDIASASRAQLFLLPNDELELRAVADSSGSKVLQAGQPLSEDGAYATSLLRYAVRTAEPVVVRDAGRTHPDPYVASGAVRSLAVIPIIERGRVVAVLHLESADQTGLFTENVLANLQNRGRRTALAIENSLLHLRLEAAEREQTTLEAAQARLIPTEFLHELGAEDLRAMETGGIVEREMSILFSDLWGYTALTESMPLEGAGRLISDFLHAVEPAIVANNGFVHDTRGDEVLALFRGGPDDTVRAAIGMHRAQSAYNEKRKERGEEPVRWGIGINHGPVFLGMVGGVNRMKAGVLGDTLNLASRIESLTRRYDSDILISDAALQGLSEPGSLHTRRAERVRVVNRAQAVTVYEVYDGDPPELLERKDAASEILDGAFDSYDTMEFAEAARRFDLYLESVPGDRIAGLHRDMAREYEAAGAPPGWDGATSLTQK